MTGHIVKVLPLFLNLKGQDAISPSLYDRDAYQVYLRAHTNEVSAIRFDVLWSTSNLDNTNLTLRLELRGIGPGRRPAPDHARTNRHAALLPPLDVAAAGGRRL